MTIAIVIGTHGWAAEQLLKTAEMLLGEQENVGWIDFVPGENAETLIEKYNAQLAKLDTTKGVLFLVDTWGGSPFNAASRIVVDKEHYEVIAGVNIPMLVETLMARDDDPSFDELVALAVETGREGVKALKAKPIEKAAPAPAAAAPKVAPTPAKPMGPNGLIKNHKMSPIRRTTTDTTKDAMFITPEFTTSFISPPLSRGAILPLLERKKIQC